MQFEKFWLPFYCKVITCSRGKIKIYKLEEVATLDDFYPHIQARLFALNWPIFILIDLRHLAKISQILSPFRSGILGYFQGSWRPVPEKAPFVRSELSFCLDCAWPPKNPEILSGSLIWPVLFFPKFACNCRIFPNIARLRRAEKMTLKELLNDANSYCSSNACNCLMKIK